MYPGRECLLRWKLFSKLGDTYRKLQVRQTAINVGIIMASLLFFPDFVRVSLCLCAMLRKDIHNASVRSFTHCAKISKSCLKWVISWNLDGLENARHLACPRSERDLSESAMLLIRPLRRACQEKIMAWIRRVRPSKKIKPGLNSTRFKFNRPN